MMGLPRYLAPAGTRIRTKEMLAWLTGVAVRRDGASRFSSAFRQRYGIEYLHLISSGRAAMTLSLSTLRTLVPPGRDEIVIPGYTCYSVAASAILAGFRVRPCDIDPASLSYRRDSLERVDFSRVVALISANLYGIPDELPYLESLCRDKGITMIDDAAQAMNARIAGRYAGTFGDLGIFSLDKGKNITSIQGGAVAVNGPELQPAIAEAVAALPRPRPSMDLRESFKLIVYATLLAPSLYWIPQRLLQLGDTPFELDYPRTRYSPVLGGMAEILLRRIDGLTADRQRIARRLAKGLEGSSWRCPTLPESEPAYPRFPLLAPTHEARDAALRALNQAGIGATGSYPAAIIDVPEVQDHLAEKTEDTPHARAVSSTVLTLPTHGFVRNSDVGLMLRLLREHA